LKASREIRDQSLPPPFAIAFVLLLGANGLRNLVERLRHGGRDYREG